MAKIREEREEKLNRGKNFVKFLVIGTITIAALYVLSGFVIAFAKGQEELSTNTASAEISSVSTVNDTSSIDSTLLVDEYGVVRGVCNAVN